MSHAWQGVKGGSVFKCPSQSGLNRSGQCDREIKQWPSCIYSWQEEQRALCNSSALLETMEVVLTRLRDFSCKETSFDHCKAAVMWRDHSSSQEVCRGKRMAGEGDAGRLDIETALAWLRKELVRFEFSRLHYIISHLDANIRQCPMITFCL